ncbi:hypothetical protein Pst134EA_030200 [Puccinia striiformis f. sp. tritici]|uniref:hypothetical protein n=1 Tax=Puccinia striiformis f. sp. tritici TaxID=168172 RepID=UPI002008BE98|nr:hypothetical protein Pst134EA_030200 [Puccinia striiformis f. sp. tritici]KAH9446279.1 hypothetical protein Pst134EA_030200 [Puccinia striiformis f. sp. tritici]
MDHFSDRVIEDVKRLLIVYHTQICCQSSGQAGLHPGGCSSQGKAPSLPNGKSSCYSVSFYSLIPSILLQQNQPVDTVCCCRECTTLDHVVPIHTKEENWQDSIPKSSI